MQTRSPRLLLLTSVLTAVLASAPVPVRAAELSPLLERFDAVQDSVRSLSAAFTMTTESVLLKDKIVSEGRIYMTKPDAVRWEFSSPEEMRFVIADNVYTGYFPVQKRAETRDIQRWREHLFRFLGLGQASDELAKFYHISLDGSDESVAGARCLILEPKKKRVRRKIEDVRFWIDEQSYLPVRVEYSSKTGDRRTIVFRNMTVNPDLAAALYTVELPPDVRVTKGFNAFASFGNPDTSP